MCVCKYREHIVTINNDFSLNKFLIFCLIILSKVVVITVCITFQKILQPKLQPSFCTKGSMTYGHCEVFGLRYLMSCNVGKSIGLLKEYKQITLALISLFKSTLSVERTVNQCSETDHSLHWHKWRRMLFQICYHISHLCLQRSFNIFHTCHTLS